MLEILRTIADQIWTWVAVNLGIRPDPNVKAWVEFAAAVATAATIVVIPYQLYDYAIAKPRDRRRQRLREESERQRRAEEDRRSQARDRQLSDMQRSLHELSQKLTQALARGAKQPVTAEAESRAAERIEAAVGDLARRTDDKSKRAFALLEKGDVGAAKRLFGEVLEEKSRAGSAANKEAAEAARNIAAFTRLASVAEAAALYARAAELDPDNVENWIDLGDLSVDVGRLAEARRAFEKAQELARRHQDQWWVMAAGNRIGDVLVAQGNLPEALKSFRDSLAIRDTLAKADPNNAGWQRDLALSRGRVAMVEAQVGERARAVNGFRQGRSIIACLRARSPDNAQLPKDLAWFDSQLSALDK